MLELLELPLPGRRAPASPAARSALISSAGESGLRSGAPSRCADLGEVGEHERRALAQRRSRAEGCREERSSCASRRPRDAARAASRQRSGRRSTRRRRAARVARARGSPRWPSRCSRNSPSADRAATPARRRRARRRSTGGACGASHGPAGRSVDARSRGVKAEARRIAWHEPQVDAPLDVEARRQQPRVPPRGVVPDPARRRRARPRSISLGELGRAGSGARRPTAVPAVGTPDHRHLDRLVGQTDEHGEHSFESRRRARLAGYSCRSEPSLARTFFSPASIGDGEAVLLRRDRAVEVVREGAGRQDGAVEVEGDGAVVVRRREQEAPDRVGRRRRWWRRRRRAGDGRRRPRGRRRARSRRRRG